MAALTASDLVNYDKLKESFDTLILFDKDKKEIKDDTTSNKIRENIGIKVVPQNTEELSRKISLIELYLTIQSSLDRVLIFNKDNQEDNNRLNHQLLTALSNITRSLEAAKGEEVKLTDGIESNDQDSLFLEFIGKVPFPVGAKSPKELTKILLNDLDPNLSANEINQLVRAWGLATNLFVEDAQKEKEQGGQVDPLQPTTFAHFFGIHNELENLYGKLADTEVFQESR